MNGTLAQVEAELALRQWQWRDTAGTSALHKENIKMEKLDLLQRDLLGITPGIAVIRGCVRNLYRDPDYVLKREFRYSHVSKKIRIGGVKIDVIVVGMRDKGKKSKYIAYLSPGYYD